MAEGRALGRHGNRIGIIYLHRRCQLSPGNGDHEIRVSEIDSHFPSLFSHSEKGFCVNWVIFPGSSRSHRKKLRKWGRARTNSAAANAARPGATSRAVSAKTVSRRSKSPTITILSDRAFRATCWPRVRPTCGAIASCCRYPRGTSPPSQLGSPRWFARRDLASKSDRAGSSLKMTRCACPH